MSRRALSTVLVGVLATWATATAQASEARFLFSRAAVAAGCGTATASDPDWRGWIERFVAADGRVIDRANRGVSHSEGQGYGMVLAAAFDDRATFDRLRAWTFANLAVRDDGLLAWRWDPAASPHVSDRNNATDGDLLVAWALAEAHVRWKAPADLAASKRLARAIVERAAPETRYGRVLLPGVRGFGEGDRPDGPVVNPSYWVFPAIERLKRVTGDAAWGEIETTGLKLLRRARFGVLRLPPEWLALGGERPLPAQNLPRVFGYNAIRIPLYLAMMETPPPDLLQPFARLWNPRLDVGPSVIELDTGAAAEPLHEAGYKLAIGVAGLTGETTRSFEPASLHASREYYPSSLELLSKVLLRERYSVCS